MLYTNYFDERREEMPHTFYKKILPNFINNQYSNN